MIAYAQFLGSQHMKPKKSHSKYVLAQEFDVNVRGHRIQIPERYSWNGSNVVFDIYPYVASLVHDYLLESGRTNIKEANRCYRDLLIATGYPVRAWIRYLGLYTYWMFATPNRASVEAKKLSVEAFKHLKDGHYKYVYTFKRKNRLEVELCFYKIEEDH